MRRYFEEVQSFRQCRWIWYVIIIFSMVLIIPLLHGIYQQFILGNPWGNTPMMSDGGLLAFILVVLLGLGAVIWMLLSVKLETYVDAHGIHYKFFPQRPSWRHVLKNDIKNIETRRKKSLFESGGLGFHRNYWRKSVSMTISGCAHIRLTLTNKHILILGTQNPEEFERAIRRMMSTDIIV